VEHARRRIPERPLNTGLSARSIAPAYTAPHRDLGREPVLRTLYALSVVMLVSGTAWSAGGMQSQRLGVDGGVGIVLLAALQR